MKKKLGTLTIHNEPNIQVVVQKRIKQQMKKKLKKQIQKLIDKKINYLLNIDSGIKRNNRGIAKYEQEMEREQSKRDWLIKLYKTDQTDFILSELEKVQQNIDEVKVMITELNECNKDNLINKGKLEKEVTNLKQQLEELSSITV